VSYILASEKQEYIREQLAIGIGIRELVRTTGVAKGTILRLKWSGSPSHSKRGALFAPVVKDGECELIAHASTAYGRRLRAWLEDKRDLPHNYVVDSNCGSANCCALVHAVARPRIDLATSRPLFAHCLDKIKSLAIGETIGIAIDSHQNIDEMAVKLRVQLHNGNKELNRFRWGVRQRNDRVLVVMKLGTWASKKKSYEKKASVAPPVDEQLPQFVRKPSPPLQLKTKAACLGCGEYFEPNGRACCSRKCSAKYRKIAAIMAKM